MKFTNAFDMIFRSEGIDVIRALNRATNTNAYREQIHPSAREERLDKLLITNQAHLRRVVCEYITFFNTARPYQGLDRRIPVPKICYENAGTICSRAMLGDISHDCYHEAV